MMKLLLKKINDFAQQIINNWVVSFSLFGLSIFLYGTLNTLSLNEPKYRELVSNFILFPVILGVVSFLIFFSVGSNTLIRNLGKISKRKKDKAVSPWFIISLLLLVALIYLITQLQPGFVSAILKGLSYKKFIPTPTPIESIKNTLLTQEMKLGSSGDEVRILQSAFTTRNYLNTNLVTGYYGDQTSKAVKLYQQGRGLQITGAVNLEFRKVFNNEFGNETRDYYLNLVKVVEYTVPANTQDSDPIVNCKSGGCPDIKVKQSQCNGQYICCQIRGGSWVWTQSMDDCQRAQSGGNYQVPQTQTQSASQIQQTSTTTNSNSDPLVSCVLSYGTYTLIQSVCNTQQAEDRQHQQDAQNATNQLNQQIQQQNLATYNNCVSSADNTYNDALSHCSNSADTEKATCISFANQGHTYALNICNNMPH